MSVRFFPCTQGEVVSSQFLPDGSLIAFGKPEDIFLTFGSGTERFLNLIMVDTFLAAVVSPCGTACTELHGSSDATLCIRSMLGGFLRAKIALAKYASVVVWSRDGRYILTQIKSFGLSIVDALNGNVGYLLRDSGTCASWSPDSKFVVTGSQTSNNANIYSTRDGNCKKNLSHSGHVKAVEWAPNGLQIATICSNQDTRISQLQFWDSRTGNPGRVLTCSECNPYILAWSSDNRYLAYRKSHTILGVWDCVHSKHILDLPDLKYSANSQENNLHTAFWSFDCTRLVVTQSKMIIQVYVKEWSDRSHRLCDPTFKEQIFYLMCVKSKLDNQNCPQPLPKLPMNVWLNIFVCLHVVLYA